MADADVDLFDLRSAKSLLAVAVLFAVNGTLVGGIGATLPAIRLRLGVDDGGLAVLLVSLAAAAVVSMQFGGRLADSRGAGSMGVRSTCPAMTRRAACTSAKVTLMSATMPQVACAG